MFMRINGLLAAAFFALALWTVPVAADPPGAAASLYAAGHYLAAADTAERDRLSAESLAFAARSALAACITSDDRSNIDALLDRAERSAKEALELDADSVDARLQLAVVYGVRGQRASLTEAFTRGYAPRGRRLIEQALAMAPNNAQANALLGAWHLEVLHRGGSAGALAYGARLSAGIAAFDRAQRLAPSDPMIPLHYARALIELDAVRHAMRADELLAAAVTVAPRDALDEYARTEAQNLRNILEAAGPLAAARAAHTRRL
jgi:tetratricopeptide (TPR) repeat protein